MHPKYKKYYNATVKSDTDRKPSISVADLPSELAWIIP
jgi:hypothetical protein